MVETSPEAFVAQMVVATFCRKADIGLVDSEGFNYNKIEGHLHSCKCPFIIPGFDILWDLSNFKYRKALSRHRNSICASLKKALFYIEFSLREGLTFH